MFPLIGPRRRDNEVLDRRAEFRGNFHRRGGGNLPFGHVWGQGVNGRVPLRLPPVILPRRLPADMVRQRNLEPLNNPDGERYSPPLDNLVIEGRHRERRRGERDFDRALLERDPGRGVALANRPRRNPRGFNELGRDPWPNVSTRTIYNEMAAVAGELSLDSRLREAERNRQDNAGLNRRDTLRQAQLDRLLDCLDENRCNDLQVGDNNRLTDAIVDYLRLRLPQDPGGCDFLEEDEEQDEDENENEIDFGRRQSDSCGEDETEFNTRQRRFVQEMWETLPPRG